MEGLIRDVSLGGLSLQATVQVDQGDTIRLLIPREGRRPEVYLEAIVWHNRVVRHRQSGQTSQLLGLVLSNAPECYVDLLSSIRSAASPLTRQPAQGQVTKREATLEEARLRAEAASRGEAGSSLEVAFDVPPSETQPPDHKPTQPTLPKPKRFQVRVKMSAKPRTRSIMVFADTADEARDLALSEAGDEWIVIEVAPA